MVRPGKGCDSEWAMTLTFFSAMWTLICAAPWVFVCVVALIWLDERLKRHRMLKEDRQTFLRFG